MSIYYSDLEEEGDSQGFNSQKISEGKPSHREIPDRKPSQRKDGSNAWKVREFIVSA